MTTTRLPGRCLTAAEGRRAREAGVYVPADLRDHRDMISPMDVFGERLRAARIPFRAHANDYGYGVTLRSPAQDWRRAEMIWLGTREGGAA